MKCKHCGFKSEQSIEEWQRGGDYSVDQAHITNLHELNITPQDYARLFSNRHKFTKTEAKAYLAGLYHGRLISETSNFFKPETKNLWNTALKCAKEME